MSSAKKHSSLGPTWALEGGGGGGGGGASAAVVCFRLEGGGGLQGIRQWIPGKDLAEMFLNYFSCESILRKIWWKLHVGKYRRKKYEIPFPYSPSLCWDEGIRMPLPPLAPLLLLIPRIPGQIKKKIVKSALG